MESSLTAPTTNIEAPDVVRLRRMLEDFMSATSEGRKESLIDQDFYDNNQLTAAERRALRKRRQPDNTFNFTRIAINGILGVLKQGATDPRAYPRNPGIDEDSADVASKTLRFVADQSRFAATKQDVAKDFLVPGTGAVIIEVDDDNRPTIQQIRWEEFVYDPYSRRQDFGDARYLGAAKWMYADDVVALYPDSKADVERTLGDTALAMVDATFEDRPDTVAAVAWADKRKSRILVVELYYREGGRWFRCVFHAGGLLEAAESPYRDEKGRPCCPIEAQSCYVDRENNRMGLVRDLRGPQSEVNKRHSKLLHILNTRQVQESSPGSGQGSADEARAEAARPDGVIPSGWQIVPTQDMATGQAQLLQEAKRVLERLAPAPAVVGRQGQQSGRAKQIDQQAGMTELTPVLAGMEEWELRVYRQAWNRCRQYWTAPDFVRVTDDQKAPEFIGVNQPVMGSRPEAVFNPETGGFQISLQPVVLGYENRLAELDVDIMLDTVPDTANLQAEQFAMLADLAQNFPHDVTFDDLLELSSMPNKRQIIERRKARMESPPPPNPLEVAKTENLKADTELKLTDAFKNKTEAEATAMAAHLDTHASLNALMSPAPAPGAPAGRGAMQAQSPPPAVR